jgi:hypothetical protein
MSKATIPDFIVSPEDWLKPVQHSIFKREESLIPLKKQKFPKTIL